MGVSWDCHVELAKILNAPVREITQTVAHPQREPGMRKKVALVVLIGGATYTELAAIRQLKHLEDFGYEIVLLVSDLTNGTKIIDDLEIPVKPIPLSPKQN